MSFYPKYGPIDRQRIENSTFGRVSFLCTVRVVLEAESTVCARKYVLPSGLFVDSGDEDDSWVH